MAKEEWNKVINDILLQVKPIKLRTEIADRFFNMLNKKDERIGAER